MYNTLTFSTYWINKLLNYDVVSTMSTPSSLTIVRPSINVVICTNHVDCNLKITRILHESILSLEIMYVTQYSQFYRIGKSITTEIAIWYRFCSPNIKTAGYPVTDDYYWHPCTFDTLFIRKFLQKKIIHYYNYIHNKVGYVYNLRRAI